MTISERTSIFDALARERKIMIGTHNRPDGDAIGSMLALAHVLGQSSHKEVIACVDAVPASLAFLPGAEKLVLWNQVPSEYKPDVFVALDCGTSSRLGEGYRFFIQSSLRINIDHHISNDYYADYNLVEPEAAATGEIIFKLLDEMNYSMDMHTAACLYAAMATDTGSFRFTNTTAETHRIAAALHDVGIDFFALSQQLFDTRTPDEIRLLASVLGSFELANEGRISVMTIQQSMMDDHEMMDAEAENFAGFARSVIGVSVAVLFREQNDSVRVSFRSRDDTDVNVIAQIFGGGGHKKASGAVVRGSLAEVREKVLKEVSDFLTGSESYGI